MTSHRCFIAVDISETVRNELSALLETLKKLPADVKWVEAENIHLTLKFLGNITPEQIASIQDFLQKCCTAELSFVIRLKGLGAFPTVERPQLVWVGVEDEANRLKGLVEKMENGLETLGFAKEEKLFSAHLTLGRLRNHAPKSFTEAIKKTAFVSSTIVRIGGVSLYQSVLTRAGALYERLSFWPFS